MIAPESFSMRILDALDDCIAVLDHKGVIQFVNQSWIKFGLENGGHPSFGWIGKNYLTSCTAIEDQDQHAQQAMDGIHDVMLGKRQRFYHEYPCHSPRELRWYAMKVTQFKLSQRVFVVVSHQEITERKLTEIRYQRLAHCDALTGLANRRQLNAYLTAHWPRLASQDAHICLAIVDLDQFKSVNDRYGHMIGDQLLVKIGHFLNRFNQRHESIAARTGGDEFVLAWPNESLKTIRPMLRLIKQDIRLQTVITETQTVASCTCSIGAVDIRVSEENDLNGALVMADQALYQAKANGGNRIEAAEPIMAPQFAH